MRKEILSNEYKNLYKRFQILDDFGFLMLKFLILKLQKKQFEYIQKF